MRKQERENLWKQHLLKPAWPGWKAPAPSPATRHSDIPLEESLKIFEEGTALIQTCKQMLDGAEQKVRLLVRGTTDEMVPFGDADSSDSGKAAEETNETEQ